MSWLVSDHTRCELGQNTASSYWNHKDVQTDLVIHTKTHAHLSEILWASTIQSKAWSWGRNYTGTCFLLVCTSSRTRFLSTFSLTCPCECTKSNIQRQVMLVSGSLFCNPDFRGAVLHNSLFKNLHTSKVNVAISPLFYPLLNLSHDCQATKTKQLWRGLREWNEYLAGSVTNLLAISIVRDLIKGWFPELCVLACTD